MKRTRDPKKMREYHKRYRTSAKGIAARAARRAKAGAKAARNGVALEVDHVVPLQGRKVSGLHVPENLKIIPKLDNRTKHARYAP